MIDDVQRVAWGEGSSIYYESRKVDHENQDIQDVHSPKSAYLKQGTEDAKKAGQSKID